MKTIYKYVFPLKSDIEEIEMPRRSIPLCVHMQNGNICMWCQIDTENLADHFIVKRKFCIVGTGHKIPEGCGTYIGSVFPEPFVFHIYNFENEP